MKRKMAPSFQPICSLERKYQKNKFVIIENIIKFWKTPISMLMGEPPSAGTKGKLPRLM